MKNDTDHIVAERISAMEDNLFEYVRLFARNKNNVFFEDDRILRFSSPIPIPSMQSNGIYKARFATNDLDRSVDDAVKPFKEKGLPFFMTLGPSSSPEGLTETLKKHGLSHVQKQSGMALDLTAFEYSLDVPAGLTIREVKSKTDLRHFFNIFAIGFDYSATLPDFICETYGDTLLDPSISWTHYLALIRNMPVATSSLFVNGKVAGLYNIITVPQARDQGIGRYMTLAPLLKGRELGCDTAILHATDAGARVYGKLGFTKYCDFDLFLQLNGKSKLSFPLSYMDRTIRNKLLAMNKLKIG